MVSFKYKFGVVLGIFLISGNLVSSQLREEPINCYICEGTTCTSQLGNINVCRGDVKQSCVTVFSENSTSVIARGCSQNINATYDRYCERNSGKCLSCSSNGCNVARALSDINELSDNQCLTEDGKNCNAEASDDLEENNDNDLSSMFGESVGEPGHWQGLPLNCYTCEGEQCASPNSVIRKCLDNDLQTCATIFSQTGTVMARGCSDEMAQKHADYCETNPDDCIECKSSGCNTAVSKTDYIECIFCDSKTNANCNLDFQNVKQIRKCHKACMTALYPRTSDVDTSYNLVRSCLDDKDLDDREACHSDPLCQSCSSSLCNTQLIPEVRKMCQHCSEESCQNPASKACKSYTSNEQCFIKFNEAGSISEMGCKSDYDPIDIHSMLVSKTLFLCDEDNCNKLENLPHPHSCRLCNSLTDKFCATDPRNVATSTECNQLPITSCYTRVLSDGHTERGCLSSLNDDQFMKCYNNNTTECSICDENVCNDEVFPSDRIACHICNSAEDITCEENPKHTDICHKYSKDQTCITAFDNQITHRGCSSELTCTSNDATKCRVCNTTDCNVFNLKRLSDAKPGVWQTLPLNCYTCSGADCQTPLTRLNMCIGDENQHCMTVFDKDGTVKRRGCSVDVELELSTYCDENSSNCFNCNSNGCNNASSLNEYISCVHCDSRHNKDCVQDLTATSLTSRRCNTACMVALQPRSSEESSKHELSRSCLDDKDLDDREACGIDGSMCKSCTSDHCNQDDVFDDRLECYSCLNENCQGPQESQVSKKCTVYMENDSCFILFDENSSVKQTGCISEFNADKLEQSLDKMIKCQGNNCNDFSLIPEPKTCYKCDSSNDANCASSPKDITTVSECVNLPNVECYTKISYGVTTTRGCVSDLIKAQRQNCLNGNDKLCLTCLGNKCNSEVFPEDRLTCHKCNSLDDPKCQDNPNSPTVCPVYSASEVCSSKLVNDVTYRGCGEDFTCDDSDKQHCKMCNTSNCNVVNLYQNNIGYPGHWQDLPINCYTCIGQECDDKSTTILRKCENNNLQNCGTVFMANKVVQRGCSDTINEGPYDRHCDENSELCTYCKSSGCNDGSSLDEYVSCLSCDSATNPDCSTSVKDISKTRKCRGKCMTSLYPRSDESNPAMETSRSCFDDKELDDRTKCERGDEFCKVCQGEKCNVDKLPEKRLSCLRCTVDCEDAETAVCPAYRENDECFILFDDSNDIIQMGCKSDFDNSTLNLLRKKMLFCEGDNCNSLDILPEPRECVQCNSIDDPLCATKPDKLTNTSSCNSMPYTSCYTMINSDGNTVRGCIADLEMETIDKCIGSGDDINCKACNDKTCNNQIYPENRQICFRCSSDDDENCQSNPIDSSACPIYEESDGCGVAITGETTIRACTSELNCNGEDRETCRLCKDNNCNTVDLQSNYIGKPGLWQDLPLNCYTCEGTVCQNSNGNVKKCENNNLQKCETVFDSTGIVVSRGCSDDVALTHGDYCDKNIGYCQQCKSSGCNNATKLSDYVDCAFCDSATNPNCVLNPHAEGIKTRKCNMRCVAALYPRSSEQDPSYELSRSCLNDKDLDDMQLCLGPNNNCKACSESGCNSFEFPTERHECWSCRGEECVDAVTKKCVTYHPTDQCYILFDNTSSVIAMGCRSEYEHAAVTDLIKSKQLLLCDGKNCNSLASIPMTQSCVVCNSTTNPQCATNPNLVIDADSCTALPYTGCFTLINKDGDTVRGCQSTLESTAFYGCHTQSDLYCSTCTGNKCNKEVFPANRTTCHRCNSLDDSEKCATSPLSNEVCPKFVDQQSCVTSFANGITYRGCSSELSCDPSDKKVCRICSASACNTVNLEHVAKDGEPGKWQDLPIKCQTCKDNECKQNQVPVEVCSNNNLQNCMTVFNAQGEVIQRGCSDLVNQVHETYCEQNVNRCFRCNSNVCNKATTTDDYVQCLSCDTSTNTSCVTNPESWKITRTCYKGCMTALYPISIEDDPAYATTRSCLDDKEPADQQTCKVGSDNLCKSCEGNECNKDNIPIDRRSCYHCSGDECQMPEKKLCSGYREKDQCSLLLDDHNNIIEAGCKSDFTIDQAITLIKSKRLLLCDGNDCNSFDSVPKSQSCSLCSSKTDTRCAIDPNAILGSTQCSRLPYTQCYSRVLADGATERGCLSSLEGNDFYDCLIGNSTTCKSCAGEKCNKDIYPVGRKSCLICDSDSDPNCHDQPSATYLSICPKYDKNDACVTSFIAGTTHRGCESDIQCDVSDRKKCRICTADGCNTVNLERKQDDNYGKWQDLPLECYECKGDACSGPLGQAKKCQNNNEQDCSIVYNSAGNVIRRGCSDEIDQEYEEYCDANSKLCFNCKSNGCNAAIRLSELIECVYCDSSKNKTCVTNPKSSLNTRQCDRSCMTTLYPSDSSSDPAYELIRTCLSDKEKDDQNNCEGPLCKTCQADSCNIDDIPTDRLRCHSCLNEDCENPVSELCPLYKKGDQCFARFDNSNSIVEMGCLSAFRNQNVTDILKTKRVYICDGDDCNSLPNLPQAQKCVVCDSYNDVNCAINATQIGTVGMCSALPYPNCFTKIASDGTTHRGCLADLSTDEFVTCILSGGDKCSHCIGDGCNKKTFPESRLQCYSCNSETDPDCEDVPTKLSSCPYVRDSEKCVTALGGNRTERGCTSQLLCDTTDKSTCRHCSSSGCNTLNLINRKEDTNHGMWQKLPLRCHNCTESECSNSLGPAVICSDGDKQDCMTVFNKQGIVVRRGCMFDVEDEKDLYCRQNPSNCISCKSNECNDAWELNDFGTCAYCNSETDASCVTRPDRSGFDTRKCQKGCMAASFTAANGTTQVIRTCLDDKELQDRHKCTGESNSDCSSCSGDSCNLFNYPKDRLTCNVCVGSGCSNNIQEYCAAYVQNDKCYAKYESGKVELSGCSSDIDELALQEWREKNQLYDCSGNNCNAPQELPTSKTCMACDSSKNVECATQPSSVNGTEVCNAPANACMTRIASTATQRGCLNTLSYQDQAVCGSGSELCEMCIGDKCNSKIYPSGRRICYICQSDKHDNCVKDPTTISICPNYSENNQCVTKFDGQVTERGCTTEVTCDVNDKDHCQICNFDGCNTQQLDGVGTIFANNLLLTLLVAIVGLRGVTSHCI